MTERVAVPLLDLKAQYATIRDEIQEALNRVVESQQFILGPEVRALEQRLGDFCGAAEVVSCANGTDALFLPLMAWALGPGDAVLVPSFTFAATAEVIALLGATPVFVDVDEQSCNLDPAGIGPAVQTARRGGLKPVGLIAVDLFGLPADYRTIESVAREHDLWVMADAAQSFGARVDGAPVGTFGAATATSFFPSKPLGCYGDGGAVLTDDAVLAANLRSLRVHGQGAHKYDTVRVGVNSRLDTLQAAVLLQKLDVLGEEIEQRQRVAELYEKGLADVVQVPQVPTGVTTAWAQYTVRVEHRDEVAARLKADGIPTAVYYPKALHEQPAYRDCPRTPNGLPVSERLAKEVLSLPMHPYLSEADQERVIRAVRQAVCS